MNSIQLYNKPSDELFEKIEDNSINLIIIDPPYEISRKTGFSSGKLKKFNVVSMHFGEWDVNFTGLDKTIKEAYRVLKPHGTIITFYDLWKITTLKEYLEKAKFKQLRFIEWVKTNPVPLNSKINYLTNAREIAITAVKVSKPTFNSTYDNGIYKYPIYHTENRIHPTQKSLPLIAHLINKHSNEDDLVLDCFAGSGSTAVACIKTNRNFIGCEIDPVYHEKAMKWIKEEQSCAYSPIIWQYRHMIVSNKERK